MNRDDREQLFERPIVRHRTENRKIGEIFRTEKAAKIGEFFRYILFLLSELIGLFAHVPKKHFTLSFVLEGYQPEIEHREELFARLEGVVIILTVILAV